MSTLTPTLNDPATVARPISRAARHTLSCKGWQQEAALRMLMNNLDPEVAEKPEDLVVYGGTGKAARNWDCFHAIVESLRALENDETLAGAVRQAGRRLPHSRVRAARPAIANSNLVGHWNNWEKFNELDRAGLMMYGQMTAGSWIYIGTQGILQGTYETFAAAAQQHFGGNLAGKLVVTGGMGGMGGAQPLAATLNGAAFLGIEVDPERIKRRVEDAATAMSWSTSLDEALRILKNAVRKGEATSVGLVGNCADVIPGTRAPRRCSRSADGPDQRARSDRRLRSATDDAGAGRRTPREQSGGISQALHRVHGPARRGHAGPAKARRGHVRLRQQHPHHGFRARA